jgi:hypothetical protein
MILTFENPALVLSEAGARVVPDLTPLARHIQRLPHRGRKFGRPERLVQQRDLAGGFFQGVGVGKSADEQDLNERLASLLSRKGRS